jgi:hypothetical protein
MRQEPTQPKPDPKPKQTEEQPPKPPRRFGIDDNPTDKRPDPWGSGGSPPPR